MAETESLSKIDGRTEAGRIGKAFRAELLAEIGQTPSQMQLALLDEAVRLRIAISAHQGGDALQRLMQVRHLLGIDQA